MAQLMQKYYTPEILMLMSEKTAIVFGYILKGEELRGESFRSPRSSGTMMYIKEKTQFNYPTIESCFNELLKLNIMIGKYPTWRLNIQELEYINAIAFFTPSGYFGKLAKGVKANKTSLFGYIHHEFFKNIDKVL